MTFTVYIVMNICTHVHHRRSDHLSAFKWFSLPFPAKSLPFPFISIFYVTLTVLIGVLAPQSPFQRLASERADKQTSQVEYCIVTRIFSLSLFHFCYPISSKVLNPLVISARLCYKEAKAKSSIYKIIAINKSLVR